MNILDPAIDGDLHELANPDDPILREMKLDESIDFHTALIPLRDGLTVSVYGA